MNIFKITYGWKRVKRNGSTAEGGYSIARRLIGRAFLGERFIRL
jgi:hypothetical protein